MCADSKLNTTRWRVEDDNMRGNIDSMMLLIITWAKFSSAMGESHHLDLIASCRNLGQMTFPYPSGKYCNIHLFLLRLSTDSAKLERRLTLMDNWKIFKSHISRYVGVHVRG